MMKKQEVKWLLFLLFVIAALRGWSQTVHAYNAQANVMWKGISNQMGFSLEGKLMDMEVIGGFVEWNSDFFLESHNTGEMGMDQWQYLQEQGYVMIQPNCDAAMVEVVFHYLDVFGGSHSESRTFRVMPLDIPGVIFQGKSQEEHTISRGQLIGGIHSPIGVKVDPSTLVEGVAYECLQFEVEVTHKGRSETFQCSGSHFSGSALRAIERMGDGDVLVISAVQTFMPCGVVTLKDRLELVIN